MKAAVRRSYKALIVLLVSISALPVVAFTVYDVVVFQSRRSEITALLSHATSEERSLSPEVQRLIQVSLGGHTAGFSGRLLLERLQVPWIGRGMLGWHLTSALWQTCTALHLSQDEQLAVIASQVYLGEKRFGFSAEAETRFQKPLSALTLEEAAVLVALMESPSAYQRDSAQLERRRDWLVGQVQHGP